MIKLTKRKGFNFFRSYYDVYNELPTDKEKVAFIDALLDRQFLGIKPTNLKGLASFAYISQTNSIDNQVRGYEDKTGEKLTPTEGGTAPPRQGGSQGGIDPPSLQVQVEGKGKVKEKVNTCSASAERLESFKKFWDYYDYKVGKGKALSKWQKLKKTDLDLIREHLPKYIRNTIVKGRASDDGKLYRKHPATYLNDETWLDEVIEQKADNVYIKPDSKRKILPGSFGPRKGGAVTEIKDLIAKQ